MKKTAIILGATGLTGSILLDLLLKDTHYDKIKLFSRNSVGLSNPKIEEHLIDLFELEKHKENYKADEVYCCIGTTKSKTPNNSVYKKIDYGIPFAAAKLCKENKIDTFIIISAMGANPESKVFYNKIKGEMERDVLKQNIQNTYILQPGLIGGNRDEKRLGESIAKFFFKILNPIIPKNYRTINPETIAKAMVIIANQGFSKTRIENQTIKEIAEDA
ncbi:MAG: NAD(P)H-binding protein [Flavobacteriaceae bacterium]|nr:NAD(P)H-binding protein [Flavobacteriaceae bacterium]